jgi:colanic acid/amylovoran biosynthesis glycosyltransferase
MRIAIVVNSFPKISETFIYNKVSQLIRSGWDVTVIAHNKKNDKEFFQEQTQNTEVEILYSNWNIGGLPSYVMLCLYSIYNFWTVAKIFARVQKRDGGVNRNTLRKTIKLIPFFKHKFDIIHFEYSGLAILYLDELDYLDCKKVISCRGTAELIKPLFDKNRGEELKRLMLKIDVAHCVSQNMRNTLLKYDLPFEKSFLNYPSIDVNYFKRDTAYPSGNAVFTIVSTGRLTWIKGYNYALLGIKNVVDKGYRVRYEIIGEGSAIDELTFIVEKLELRDSVLFRGNLNRAKVKEALEITDVFLLPSLSEGVSNAALEAMSMEIPTISTKVGGMNEVIANGENGLVINEMQPGEIADSLIYLIKNKEVARKLGENGRESIKKGFSLTNQTEIFLKEYKKLSYEHKT